MTSSDMPAWALKEEYVAPLFRAYDARVAELEDQNSAYNASLTQLRSEAERIVSDNTMLLNRVSELEESEDRLLDLEGSSVTKGGFGAAEKQEYEARLDALLQENNLCQEQLRLMGEEVERCNRERHTLEEEFQEMESQVSSTHTQ